jgi:large subunit ribosomal protein L23
MRNSLNEIVRRPIVTEKTTELRDELNQYVFEVSMDANKIEVREAVEALFGVRVADVRTSIVGGKRKRMRKRLGIWGKGPNWKRAVVTLRAGDTIQFFEGV